MFGSVRNGEYFFLGTHNVPPGFAPGNIEGLRETKLIVLLWPVIKCLRVMYPLMFLQCFSAESIFEELEEEHHEEEEEHEHEEEKALNQEEFEQACASIVLHLVQGFCIEEGHGHNETQSSLPKREFFIKDLFKDKTHLTEGDLEDILKILGIGTGESDDHDHRRRRSVGSNLLPQRRSSEPHRVHRRAADDHGETNGATSGRVSYDEYLVN